jgi:hypothetical protein
VVATDPEALFFEAIANSFNNMDPHLVDIDIIHIKRPRVAHNMGKPKYEKQPQSADSPDICPRHFTLLQII